MVNTREGNRYPDKKAISRLHRLACHALWYPMIPHRMSLSEIIPPYHASSHLIKPVHAPSYLMMVHHISPHSARFMTLFCVWLGLGLPYCSFATQSTLYLTIPRHFFFHANFFLNQTIWNTSSHIIVIVRGHTFHAPHFKLPQRPMLVLHPPKCRARYFCFLWSRVVSAVEALGTIFSCASSDLFTFTILFRNPKSFLRSF